MRDDCMRTIRERKSSAGIVEAFADGSPDMSGAGLRWSFSRVPCVKDARANRRRGGGDATITGGRYY